MEQHVLGKSVNSTTCRCNGPRVVPCRKSAEVCFLRIAHARSKRLLSARVYTGPELSRAESQRKYASCVLRMLFMRTAGVVVHKHLRPIRMINISNNTVREMSHAVKIYRTKPLLLPLLTYIYIR